MGRPRSGAPPTSTLGQPMEGLGGGMGPGLPRWTELISEDEYVPEFTWPSSITICRQMRTDSQLAGLLSGTILPILRYRWYIDPNGAREEAVSGVAKDLNLPVKDKEDEPKGRMKKRFTHSRHAREALTGGLIYGHAWFEQVGTIEDDQWRLRKLMPLPQRTVSEVRLADDGGLIYIKQGWTSNRRFEAPTIPVDRLVAYPWEMEGANWFGRSIMRDCYRNWLIKDRLMRIDAINHENAGGIPYAVGAQGDSTEEIEKLNELMSHFKVGQMRGAAVPFGSKIEVARGTGSDVVASMRYHDELMARKFLLMLLQLGQTQTGSRSLGNTFLDFFAMGQEYVADWYRDITNEHVIEDWIDWNYGEDEEFAPLLAYEPMENRSLAIADLATMVEKGIIIVDEALEDAIRYRYGLTKRQGPRPKPVDPADVPPDDEPPEGQPQPSGGKTVAAGLGAPSGPQHRPSGEAILPELSSV